jgi:hypothetical protein
MYWLREACKFSYFEEINGAIDHALEQKIATNSPEVTHVEIVSGARSPLRLYERLGKALLSHNPNTHVKALRINPWNVYADENVAPLLQFLETSSGLMEVHLTGGSLLTPTSELDEQKVVPFIKALSRNNNVQVISLHHLPIPVNGLIDLLRSVRSNIRHLMLYFLEFKNTEEPLIPGMILDTFTALTKLSSVTLGVPFITETNVTETILAALFQNSNIEKLILLYHSNNDDDRMEPQESQLLLNFIRKSKSLKHVSFYNFYWVREDEDEGTIPGAWDFGPVARAIQESDSIAEVAFYDCNFPFPSQIPHLKSIIASPSKPRTLILGEGTLLYGIFDEDDDEHDFALIGSDMGLFMRFVGGLVTSSPGLCQLDVREFREHGPEIPSRRPIMDALKEDASAPVKSVLLGLLSSEDLGDLVQCVPLFPHLQKIQFEIAAEQENSRQKALLLGSLFRNSTLHCIDSSTPTERKEDDDDSKKEELMFLTMIGQRNQQLLDLLLDFSYENRFGTPPHFVPLLLAHSLNVASPLHLRGSFQSLLRLEEYQRDAL